MSNEVTTAAAPQLPAALAGLATSLQRTVAALPGRASGGYLSFAKHGEWTLGQDNEHVGDADLFAVNIMGVKTGYICWPDDEKQRKNGPLGTVAVPLGQTVDASSLDNSLPGKWVDYAEVPVKFVGGELDGEEAVYNTNSKGGIDAVRGLLDAVVKRLSAGNSYFVPVISPKVDSYPHKTYGKTFFPVLDIVEWLDMEGNKPAQAAAAAPAAPAPAAPVQEAPAEPEPAEAAAGEPVRRRRRA